MKYTLLALLIAFLFTNTLFAQQIAFKDKNLKDVLLEKGYDTNRSGEIEVAEIDTVSSLNLSNRKIESLDGLSYFKSLKMLNANNNRIANLEGLFGNNSITELYIMNNRLGKKLALKNFTGLEVLSASQNGLEEIEFIGTENIRSLYLMNNALIKMDLKGLPLLQNADLSMNKPLNAVNIGFNKALTELYLLDTSIPELNVSQNPLLKTLYVERKVKLIKGNSAVRPAPIVREIH